MKMAFLFFINITLFFNCYSGVNYEDQDKLQLNDNLFVVKTAVGYDAIDANNVFLFPLPYDEIQPLNDQGIKFFKVKKGTDYGIIDFNAIEMVNPEYDKIISLENKKSGESYLKMNLNGKWGLMIFPGKLVRLPFGFEEIGDFGDSDRLLLVKNDGKYGFKDLSLTTHHRSTRLIYDSLENYKKEGSEFVKDGQKGKLVISNQTGFLMEIMDGSGIENKPLAKVGYAQNKRFEENKLWGIKNRKTKEILIPAIYESIYDRELVDRIIWVGKKEEKWGAFDEAGKQIIPFVYKSMWTLVVRSKVKSRSIGEAYEDVFIVETESGKSGLINSNNQILIPLKYDKVIYSRNNTFIVMKDGKSIFYDVKKNGLTDGVEWDKIKKVTHREAYIAEKNNLKAIVDLDGHQITAPIYEFLAYKDRKFYFKNPKDKTQGAFTEDGHLCTPLFSGRYSYGAPNFYYKYERTKDSVGNIIEKQIYFDNLGQLKPLVNKIVSRGNYSNIQAFAENKKIGIMDRYTEAILTKPTYEEVKLIPPFTNKIIAKRDGKWGIVNLKGDWLATNQYDLIEVFTDVLSAWTVQFAEKRYQFKVMVGTEYGIINDRGDVLVDIGYANSFTTFMLEEYRDFVVVKKDGLYGLCKFGLLKKPNAFFEKIYTGNGKLWVVKEGKKLEATITKGNFISY